MKHIVLNIDTLFGQPGQHIVHIEMPQALLGQAQHRRIDLDGIAITRYPPGMTAALAKMTAVPTAASKAVSHLWAVGSGPSGATPGSYGIDERLELLQEL